jgi:LuxR family transcriptional regulator, maltose regulon positive regulatory protein
MLWTSNEVESWLITTKFYVPPASPGLVIRPRLLQRLAAAADYSFTLVSAPAGFGKTTLLAEWVRQNQSKNSVAWISLDESENDLVRFWEYLIAALKTVLPGIGEMSLTLLHSSTPLPIESVLAPLINDLAAIQTDCFLVLDDYHFINLKSVHDSIVFFLEHLPPRLHLVIATRKDPPLPLSRLRGKGMLLEIRADDLRFNEDEASALLNGPGCLTFTSDDIRSLNRQTEGWAVGLKMVTLSLQGEKDIPAFLSGFAEKQRYITDYLFEEVLQRQPPEVRDFLLKTSVLDRLSGSLCDAVTGKTDSRKMLARLESDNLFVVPLDASRDWYRYEHLFAGLLRNRLELELGKDGVKELQIKASLWYEHSGLVEEAIHQAFAAREWKRVMKLLLEPDTLEKYGITGNHGGTLFRWMKSIPEELLITEPQLYCEYIWTLILTGQLNSAESCLKILEQAAADDSRLQGRIATIRTYICRILSDAEHIEDYARKAMLLLPPEDDSERAIVYESLAMVFAGAGRHEEAESLAKDAYRIFTRVGDQLSIIAPLKTLGVIKLYQGKLYQADTLLRQALGIAEQHLENIFTLILLGFIYCEWNDLETAMKYLTRSLEAGRISDAGLSSGSYLMVYACMTIVRVKIAQGDNVSAAEVLHRCDQILAENKNIPSLSAQVSAAHINLAIAQEDAESTSKWIDKLAEYEANFPGFSPQNAIRRIYLRSENPAGLLQAAYERCNTAGLGYDAIGVRLGQALISPIPSESLSFLAEALTKAEPEGLIRIFADEGMALAPLLRQAISQGIKPVYAAKLLAIIEAEDRRRKLHGTAIPSFSPVAGLLSERELEVLKLIQEGLTNPQIAARLVISLNTTKTHVHHILEKLDAGTRTRAITRARELKLI